MQLSEPRDFYLDVDCRYPNMRLRGEPTDGLVVNGRTAGNMADGYECPFFTKPQAETIVEAVIRSMNNNGDDAARPYYDHVYDAFVFVDIYNRRESIKGVEWEGKTYYPIHGQDWNWVDTRPPQQRELPQAQVLYVGDGKCPFCRQPGTVCWADTEHDTGEGGDIHLAGHCESAECDVYFDVTYNVTYIQAFTDETMRFERGKQYAACTLRRPQTAQS